MPWTTVDRSNYTRLYQMSSIHNDKCKCTCSLKRKTSNCIKRQKKRIICVGLFFFFFLSDVVESSTSTSSEDRMIYLTLLL